jgi:hypothetical protein
VSVLAALQILFAWTAGAQTWDLATDWSEATQECLANDELDVTLEYSAVPDAGTGSWFLVRRVTAGGNGTYDESSVSQVEGRDVEIASASAACP